MRSNRTRVSPSSQLMARVSPSTTRAKAQGPILAVDVVAVSG